MGKKHGLFIRNNHEPMGQEEFGAEKNLIVHLAVP
jgi:hypothetical protein